MISLERLQHELKPWVERNYGSRPAYWPLLGVGEEVGELMHAHLKQEQGIRKGEDHIANAKDAVGDIMVYLADYCNARGWDMQEILDETWAKVRERDWVKDPVRGGEHNA